ncbi:TPA: cytoskeleton protein RodZ [Morganella morganii]|uniref:Cytoskeleton protein RodZ n=3 Tax=Enterobacterales TaxID=91347 RepID=A0AAN5MC54_MORMO|nr:cytoskeleton protein RodZ [Morganella morganii]MCU6375365.1 cytoskeleton protein RodZ [Morganella morganii]HAT3807351.1 cytoskeleton protein RodZ [Morganella morganii]HBH7051486.1 cytoskeleton protein RodZ [Morganella morganii]HED3888887.1 cytoskeleton protein RodZ [Morganella morganii]
MLYAGIRNFGARKGRSPRFLVTRTVCVLKLMNNSQSQDNLQLTLGQFLTQRREQLQLSRETVADRLCLKLTTVREIEEDALKETNPTFIRGYIRTYAKLLQIPESAIMPYLDNIAPAQMTKVQPMKSVTLGRQRKKREGWLMKFTWLVLLVVLALVGVWWWQQYQAQQADIASLAQQNDVTVNAAADAPGTDPADGDAPQTLNAPAGTPDAAPAGNTNTAALELSAATPQDQEIDSSKIVPLPGSDRVPAVVNRAVDSEGGTLPTTTQTQDGLVLTFKNTCWLEVTDNKGTKIFSGTKQKGDTLEFAGAEPYRLKIGAPAAVDVQFKGQSVDLSRFIKANTVAKLSVPKAGE